MEFFKCVLYLAAIGIISFAVGRLLPKQYFQADRFPYRAFSFEQDGKIYLKLKIRTWMNKVPDMSRILPHLMPQKKLNGNSPDHLPLMIQETCVAEVTHVCLCILGLYCTEIWDGTGGMIIFLLNLAGNLPFIFIQRYNRPKLVRMMKKYAKRPETATEDMELIKCEHSY